MVLEFLGSFRWGGNFAIYFANFNSTFDIKFSSASWRHGSGWGAAKLELEIGQLIAGFGSLEMAEGLSKAESDIC